MLIAVSYSQQINCADLFFKKIFLLFYLFCFIAVSRAIVICIICSLKNFYTKTWKEKNVQRRYWYRMLVLALYSFHVCFDNLKLLIGIESFFCQTPRKKKELLHETYESLLDEHMYCQLLSRSDCSFKQHN